MNVRRMGSYSAMQMELRSTTLLEQCLPGGMRISITTGFHKFG